ncbi:MAG: hypothetical protein ACXVR1_05130, partial [Solirubrobacteraceae bacterium]
RVAPPGPRLTGSGLFAHFGSKQELQLETVQAASELFEEHVWEPVADVDPGLVQLAFELDAVGSLANSLWRSSATRRPSAALRRPSAAACTAPPRRPGAARSPPPI